MFQIQPQDSETYRRHTRRSTIIIALVFIALAMVLSTAAVTRVLIDDVGARYTQPTMIRRLRDVGVPVAAFLPTRVPRLFQYANLRMHRKILVVDGTVTIEEDVEAGVELREEAAGLEQFEIGIKADPVAAARLRGCRSGRRRRAKDRKGSKNKRSGRERAGNHADRDVIPWMNPQQPNWG